MSTVCESQPSSGSRDCRCPKGSATARRGPAIDFDETVRAALGGDTLARKRLVGALLSTVQCRVARALLRQRGASARDLRQDVEDLTQEVFLLIFERDGKILRAWDPEQGLSLPNFVGLVAERRVASVFRSQRQNPWNETTAETETLQRRSGSDPERDASERQYAALLLESLREQLSPLGLHLFYALFRDQRPVEEICLEMNMSRDAVYAWRSRLRKAVRKAASELGAGGAP